MEAMANVATMEQVNAAINNAINEIPFQSTYSGTSIPDDSMGKDGDIYIVKG